MRYDSELMQALGLRLDTKVGYYYMEGDLLMCWSPQSRECVSIEALRSVYHTLNTYTKEIYSQDSAAREELNSYIRKRGCKLIRGGPLDGKCIIGHHQLPWKVLDVFDITKVEVVTMPNHDLWELVREGSDNNIYLVTSDKYTVYVGGAGSYYLASNPSTVRASAPAVSRYDDDVVCQGTEEYCLRIGRHLEQAYEDGKEYTYTQMGYT